VLRLLSQTTTWDVVTKLLGDDCIEPDVAQVAVKLPEAVSPQPMTAPPSDLHIDGMHTDTSGVPSGQLHNFSLLVGVPLSTVQAQPDGGCLHVLPGSHLAISHALRASPAGVHTLTEADTTVSVADRLARVIDFSTGRPLPLTVRRGDVYLCHPALAHCVGANGTSEPRVAAYFRVYAGARRTVDGGVQLARHSALLDPWLEYPSLKQLDSVLSCWSS